MAAQSASKAPKTPFESSFTGSFKDLQGFRVGLGLGLRSWVFGFGDSLLLSVPYCAQGANREFDSEVVTLQHTMLLVRTQRPFARQRTRSC